MPSKLKALTSSIKGIKSKGGITVGRDLQIIIGDHNNIHRSPTRDREKSFAFQVDDPPMVFEPRLEFLDKLRECTKDNVLPLGIITTASCTTVISGGPGFGKTMLAKLFIKMYGKEFKYQVWISAENVNVIRNRFIELGETQLDIHFLEEEKKDDKKIAARVYEKLCESPSLIVFDNAETATTVDELGLKQGISYFFPSYVQHDSQQPVILVTTRITADAAWINHAKHILRIGTFTEAECLSYFTKKVPLLVSFKNDCLRLANFYDRLPIAISTVATLMKTEADDSLGTFNPMDLFMKLTTMHDERKVEGTARSVYSKLGHLWVNLIEKLQKVPEMGEKAIQLLNVLSVLSSTGIPVQFLLTMFQNYPKDEVSAADLPKLLKLLQKLSFLSINNDNDVIYIHVLLQTYVQNTLEQRNELCQVLESCAKLLIEIPDMLSYKTRYFAEYFKNFARLCDNCIKYLPDNDDLNFKLAGKLAPYLPLEAIHYIERIIEKTTDISIWLLHTKMLAECNFAIGFFEKSIENLRQVYELEARINGKNHADTLDTKHKMALCYACQGKNENALQIYAHLYMSRVQTLGRNHHLTLTTKNNMANRYSDLGRREKALETHQEVYDARVQTLGEDHTDTLGTKHNLAVCYSDLGDNEKALEMYRQVYDARVQTLGKYHHNTLSTKNNMATSYSDLGNEKKALEMYQQVYDARVQTLGENHPNTLSTKNNIANSYSGLGKNEKALEMYQQVYDARVQILGENHPYTLSTKKNLAICYSNLSKKEKVMSQQANVAKLEVLEEIHLETRYQVKSDKKRCGIL